MRLSCGHILPGTTEEAGGTLHILMLSVFPPSKQDSLHLNTQFCLHSMQIAGLVLPQKLNISNKI